ncbi:MAG: hypothetical protein AB3N63_12380 [Puniceicoccaceae bacterium]
MDINSATVVPHIQQAQSAQSVKDAELIDATQKFEAVFLRQFLGDALKPLLHATPGSDGPGAGFYQYMMTDVIANSLTSQEQFGMASLLQMQLGEQAARLPEAESDGAVRQERKQ